MKPESNEIKLNNLPLGAEAPNGATLTKTKLAEPSNKLDKFITSLNNIAHKVSCVIVFLMMVLTTVDVLGRNFFNKPITGAYELTGLSLALMVFFSLGIAQIKKDHIEIDFLTNFFPAKVQHGLYAVTSLIIFSLLCVTTWQLFVYAQGLMASGELTGDLGWKLYPFAFLATVGALFFTLTFILDIVRSIVKVVQS